VQQLGEQMYSSAFQRHSTGRNQSGSDPTSF